MKSAERVRETISLTGQFAAVDEILTGRENLVLVARLRHLPGPEKIADDLLARFSLTEAGRRRAATYSGGMRRRLDIAMSMIGDPAVIFLDEPTTGLDPQARLEVWDAVRELAGKGTTVLLTTQYLDEADQLADRLVVIDHGRIIAQGTPLELKNSSGATSLVVTVSRHDTVEQAAELLREIVGEVHVDADARRLTAPGGDVGALTRIAGRLDEAGIDVDDLGMQRPSLDDVFLALTGHKSEDSANAEAVA